MVNVVYCCALALLCLCIVTPSSSQQYSFQGKEYFLVKPAVSNFVAAQACKNRKESLVKITSQEENDYIFENIVKPTGNWFQLGAKSIVGSNAYEWSDGTMVSYANWQRPPNNDVSKVYIACMMPSDGQWWYYESNTFSAFALCEKSVGSKPKEREDNANNQGDKRSNDSRSSDVSDKRGRNQDRNQDGNSNRPSNKVDDVAYDLEILKRQTKQMIEIINTDVDLSKKTVQRLQKQVDSISDVSEDLVAKFKQQNESNEKQNKLLEARIKKLEDKSLPNLLR